MTVLEYLQSLSDERFADYLLTIVYGVIEELFGIKTPQFLKDRAKKRLLVLLRKEVKEK